MSTVRRTYTSPILLNLFQTNFKFTYEFYLCVIANKKSIKNSIKKTNKFNRPSFVQYF